ncbi:WD40-repeat-containing domain protein [Geopyxis carbonaria]|nr:WD40-repeat-containing domain protein [Geopyxis carbonaria]
MSSFFTLPGSARKRKRTEAAAAGSKKSRAPNADVDVRPARGLRKKKSSKDDEISSDDEDAPAAARGSDDDEDDETAGETAAERRLRLAQQYLDNIREEVDEGGFDAADIDRDLIAERLQEDVAEEKGRIHRFIASQYAFESAPTTLFRTNNSPTTGLAVCAPHVYTVSRDRHLTQWLLPPHPAPAATPALTPSRKPTRVRFARGGRSGDTSFQGHIGAILCVAASADGRFVATGGADHRLVIWDAPTLTVLRVFPQHRAAVTALAFRRGTNELFSGSADRTLKLWSLNELAYIETLHGHADAVLAVSALAGDRCVSAGARDKTAMLWKPTDETRLVFLAGGGTGKQRFNKDGSVHHEPGSLDAVVMLDDETFVTGGDNGAISLWSAHKKKAVHVVQVAHGLAPPPTPEQSSAEATPPEAPPCPPQPRYITALASLPYSDLVFSGSWDGSVRVWRVTGDKRRLEPAGVVGPEGGVRGVVNAIAVAEREGEITVVVGTGTEMRLGRWMGVPGRNGGYVLQVGKREVKAIEAAPEGEGEMET